MFNLDGLKTAASVQNTTAVAAASAAGGGGGAARSPSGSISAMTGSGKMIRPAPAEIEFKNMRFLITEQPQDASIQNYIRILRDHRVTHLVCATDPTYNTEDIEHEGVRFTSIPFPDGSPPTQVCLVDVVHRQHCRKSCLTKGWQKRQARPKLVVQLILA